MSKKAIIVFILTSFLLNTCTSDLFNDNDVIIWQGYNSYNIQRVSDSPLFKADGTIDKTVLSSLMAIINDRRLDPMLRKPMQAWPTGLTYSGPSFRFVTAEDFSSYVVPNPINRDHSGVIIIKLFETISGGQSENLTKLTSQWWQLVYRSTDDKRDVLTLWMFEPYRLSVFNGNRYDSLDPSRMDERFTRVNGSGSMYRTQISIKTNNTTKDDYGSTSSDQGGYTLEGNYSASIVRTNLQHDAEDLLNALDIRRFIATPAELPGQWQSSNFQTGSNYFGRFYVSGQFQESDMEQGYITGSANMMDGLGAASRIWGAWDLFFLCNGMDGLSVGPDNGQWRHTIITSAYQDLLWLPSDFETRTMGHNKDNARFQTFIENPDDPDSALITNTIPETRPDVALGRSGLWRLNGYDRGYTRMGIGVSRAWVRSGDSVSIGNVNTISPTGNRYEHGVINVEAVRPGIHLDISSLVKEFGN